MTVPEMGGRIIQHARFTSSSTSADQVQVGVLLVVDFLGCSGRLPEAPDGGQKLTHPSQGHIC